VVFLPPNEVSWGSSDESQGRQPDDIPAEEWWVVVCVWSESGRVAVRM
jgi:hypothetical protein